MFEPSWPWVATWTDQLKISEISLGKKFLSLAFDFFFVPLFSSRLGSENRLMDEAVVSTLSSHLGEEVIFDLGKGPRGRKNHGSCHMGGPYMMETRSEPHRGLRSKQSTSGQLILQ